MLGSNAKFHQPPSAWSTGVRIEVTSRPRVGISQNRPIATRTKWTGVFAA